MLQSTIEGRSTKPLRVSHRWSKGCNGPCRKAALRRAQEKPFCPLQKKGITERCGTLNTISEKDLEKDPILLAASLDPRYRKMKCMAAEDGASVQGAVQILSINEAKENHSAGDSLQQQKTTNVQPQKSALDNPRHSDTDSQTEN